MPSRRELFTTAASVTISFDERLQRRMAQHLAYPWIYERTNPVSLALAQAPTQASRAERRSRSQTDYAPFYH